MCLEEVEGWGRGGGRLVFLLLVDSTEILLLIRIYQEPGTRYVLLQGNIFKLSLLLLLVYMSVPA